MITIVSGFMRSGTSMMMQALEAGGIEAVYNKSRDNLNDKFGDEYYKINAGGFYELSRQQYLHPEFPDTCDGKVVKFLYGGIPLLRASDRMKYIIFMRRPIAEIATSYEAAFGKKHPEAIMELSGHLDKIQGILMKRVDVKLLVVQYHDVLKNPIEKFQEIKDFGIPIDAELSAAVVDISKYRHRNA